MLAQPEQRRSAQDRESRRDQQRVESRLILRQPRRRRLQPRLVVQRHPADLEGGPGHGPRTELVPQPPREAGRSDGKAQAHAGQSIGLAEGSQHDGVGGQSAGKARLGRQQVDEGFVDDQHRRFDRAQRSRGDEPAGGIVRIDEHDDVGAGRLVDVGHDGDVVTGAAPAHLMLGVGRPDDGDPRLRHQPRQELDQRLGAGRGHDRRGVGDAVAPRRRRQQRLSGLARRQARPGLRRQAAPPDRQRD